MEPRVDVERDVAPAMVAAASEATLAGSEEVRPPAAAGSAALRVLVPGMLVGRYVVEARIGVGGMGVVHAAYDPQLDRRIALKLLRAELGDDDKRRTRLLREGQALAKLAHPNVVAILDMGTLDGRVWLAMELVRGQTLSAWLRSPRPWRDVLRVLRSAGEGLAAAHAAGLLHRDFKPANVMIGDDGRVRVMDFGLARAQAGADKSVPGYGASIEPLALEVTNGALVGTPSYMAPEHFAGAEITAATDQFAFCVTSWEALHGERPFVGETLAELATNLMEGRRATASRGRVVPRELQRVLERGLAREPDQRWPSMQALLAALDRASAAHGRRRLGAAVSAGLLLAGGLALWVGPGRDAPRAPKCAGAAAQLAGIWDDARREQARAAMLATGLPYAASTWERVRPRLDEYAAAWTLKHTEVCEATSVRGEQDEAVMDLRMSCLREHKAALDAVVKVLAEADAEVVSHAVELGAGLPGLTECDEPERIAAQHQRVPPPGDPRVAEVEGLVGQLDELQAEQRAGRYARALERVEPIVAQATVLAYEPLLAEAKALRGVLLDQQGRYAEAERDLVEAYELAVVLGHDEIAFATSSRLGSLVGVRRDRHAEGLRWSRTAMTWADRDHDETKQAQASVAMASVLVQQAEHAEAERLLRRALELRERASDPDPVELSLILNSLAKVLLARAEHVEAERWLRRALELRERALGPEHPLAISTLDSLGTVLGSQGKSEEAERAFRSALALIERSLGPNHPKAATILNNLGAQLTNQGRYEEAETYHRRALEINVRYFGEDHSSVAKDLANMGIVLYRRGRLEQAERSLRRAIAIGERVLGADHPSLANSLNNLAAVLYSQGEYDEAERSFRRVTAIQERALGPDHPDVAMGLTNLGALLERQGKHEQAEHDLRRALEVLEGSLGSSHPFVAHPLVVLASVALAQGDLAMARTHAERAIAVCERPRGSHSMLGEARFVLARSLWPDPTQRARARELAQRARDAYEAGGASEGEMAEVDRWLAEHASGARGDRLGPAGRRDAEP